jgi:hypothetical protein
MEEGRGRDGGERIVGSGDTDGIGIDQEVVSVSGTDNGPGVGRGIDTDGDMMTSEGREVEVQVEEIADTEVGVVIGADREGKIEIQGEMIERPEGMLIEDHDEAGHQNSETVDRGETDYRSMYMTLLTSFSDGVWSYFKTNT